MAEPASPPSGSIGTEPEPVIDETPPLIEGSSSDSPEQPTNIAKNEGQSAGAAGEPTDAGEPSEEPWKKRLWYASFLRQVACAVAAAAPYSKVLTCERRLWQVCPPASS